mgnify:CR=1 FL=1
MSDLHEHPNAALTRTMLEAFGRGDLDAVAGAFAPGAVWELPGRGSVAGTYKGPQEIVGFLARCFELSGGTLAVQPMAILAGDWGAVQVQRTTAHRDGKVLDCVEVLAHEIHDGRIVRTYHRPDQAAVDDFFG